VLNVDPLFVSQPPVGLGTSGDLHLQACSPAIDAGTASGAPGTDKDGLGRVDAINSGGLVDIGAYEYQSDLDADNDGYAYCGGTDCNDNPANGGTAINPATVWYQDADNDGYSNGSTLMQCAQPSGYKLATNLTATSGDCNDGNAAINPAATEVCDGIDNNCNNSTDEGNVCCPAGGILYVNASATGLNNGRSWTDAYTSLQSAIASTCPGISQIWVAAGTYKPTTGADRSISFVMKNNLAIYGGFNGSETSLTERNWTGNVTILSGNIGDDNSNSDNSYHVISNFNNGLNSSAILDGFTISGGNANGSSQNSLGGGMSNFNSSPGVRNCSFSGNSAYYGGGMGNMQSSSPSVTNCSFTGNSAGSGGGMQNEYNSSPIISNCIFGNNTATSYGGGMYNNSSSPSLSNCSLSDNTASSGGGMYNNNSSPSLSNCSFPDNTATNNGGGMLNSSSSPSLNNCSFSNNTATNNGGGINNYFSSSPAVTNCSFSGNSAGYYGGGMYNTSASSPIVNNSNFSDNSAQYGGGMYNIGTSPNVTNCSFSGNSASIDGGGMLNLSFSSPNLTNCSFTGNHANGDGGGMDNENSSPTLTTCIFPAIRQVKAAVCTTGTPSRT
jgi:parallel beta-helix repeat protein